MNDINPFQRNRAGMTRPFGLYDPANGKRLPVVTSVGTVDQDRLFLLAKVTVGQ